jgi:hypothetical protein
MKEPDPNWLIFLPEFSLKVRRRICPYSSTFPFTQHPQFNFFSFISTPSHITYHIRVSKISFKSQFTLFITIFPLNIKIEYFHRFTNFPNNVLSKHNLFQHLSFLILTKLNTHQAKYIKLNIIPL